jgi:hypothetical protein
MTSFAEDAVKGGDRITGRLRLVETRHPNGTRIIAYQIVTDHPLALAGDDEFCPEGGSKTFHLVANDKSLKARLHRLLTKKISVVAEAFFCSETAWHVGDAVISQWRFADKPIP